MKLCSNCQQELPVESFHKKESGYQSRCKRCQNAYTRQHYQDNKKYYSSKARKNEADLRAYVRELKDGKPCMDCGETLPWYCMDYDHRGEDKKLHDVSSMIHLGSKRKIDEEIAKCDLVCANCHRKRTHERRSALTQ